ncbi:MAG: glycosyltransferase family 39 protein, partial [Actinomycetota bacterium]
VVAAVPNAWHLRTNAADVARAIAAGIRPGDVVVYCPDQLGPATSRLLPASVPQVTFPDGDGPQLVNWVAYHDRHRARSSRTFAQELSAATGPEGRVWLVYAWKYRTAGIRCTQVADALTRLRTAPTTVVRPDSASFERARLLRYPALQP